MKWISYFGIFLFLSLLAGFNAGAGQEGAATTADEHVPNQGKFHIIVPGQSIDSVKLGSSTVADVLKAFGKGGVMTVSPIHVMLTSGECVFHEQKIVKYHIEELEFRAAWDVDQVNEIIVKLPCNCKTKEGIITGRSTMEDVTRVYGARGLSWGDETQKNDCLFYGDKGISFTIGIDSLKSGYNKVVAMKLFTKK